MNDFTSMSLLYLATGFLTLLADYLLNKNWYKTYWSLSSSYKKKGLLGAFAFIICCWPAYILAFFLLLTVQLVGDAACAVKKKMSR